MISEDSIWGTGVDIGSAEAADASKWPGTNILGWALVEARRTLKEQQTAAKQTMDEEEEGAEHVGQRQEEATNKGRGEDGGQPSAAVLQP